MKESPPAALVRPAPGERTISNAEVPLPRSPLSLAADTALRKGLLSVLRRTMGSALGDARGGAPCIRKLKISPFPPGRGAGGWGQKIKLKAGIAGDQKGKPPCGFRNGNVSRRPAGQAPQRAPTPQVQPVPPPAQARGCKGRSPPPPIKTARNPRPQSGRGRSRPARSGSSGNADYISIPMFLFSASSSEQRQQRQRSAEPQRHLRR